MKSRKEKYSLLSGIFIISILVIPPIYGQELFPYAESANTQPKGAFSYRVQTEYFKDLQSNFKNWYALTGIYGINRNLTVQLGISGSNHHIKNFPRGYAAYFLNHHTRYNSDYSFRFEGFHILVKYRWLKWDGFRKHLRIASYAEGGLNKVAHDEAEPNLMGDNSGWGLGSMATVLLNRFACSIASGYVVPSSFYEPKSEVRIRSGNMFLVNMSSGYLLLPKKYTNYQDLNVSLYAEFLFRSYDIASLSQKSNVFDLRNYTLGDAYTFNSLQAQQYCDLRTSIQFVFNSKSRIDVGAVWKLWKQSYVHQYPILRVTYQRNLFKRHIPNYKK